MITIYAVVRAVIDFYIGDSIQKFGDISPSGTCEITVEEKVATVTLDTKGMKGTLNFQGDNFYFTYDAEANITDQDPPKRRKIKDNQEKVM